MSAALDHLALRTLTDPFFLGHALRHRTDTELCGCAGSREAWKTSSRSRAAWGFGRDRWRCYSS